MKYIVDNLSNQSITGKLTITGGLTASDVSIEGGLVVAGGLTASDVSIEGGLVVAGGLTASDVSIEGGLAVKGGLVVTDGTYSVATYRALLTQTIGVATEIAGIDGAFIIGETYTITDYVDGDDFSNIASIQPPGTYNATGSVFVATGEIPNSWTNGSTITSSGNLAVSVLENTLGYDLSWYINLPGVYTAVPSGIGHKYNNFPRSRTSVFIQDRMLPISDDLRYYASVSSHGSKDNSVSVHAWNATTQANAPDLLYLAPVEIKIKQNINTTPVTIAGSIVDIFPFSAVTVRLKCNGYGLETFSAPGTIVNDLAETISLLNSETETSFLGVFSDDGSGGIELAMPANLVERFNPYGTLTFEVFAD
jgi:hypothetical protein